MKFDWADSFRLFSFDKKKKVFILRMFNVHALAGMANGGHKKWYCFDHLIKIIIVSLHRRCWQCKQKLDKAHYLMKTKYPLGHSKEL